MNFITKFLASKFPKKVPQTGLIVQPPSPTDRLAGFTVKEERLVNGIWSDYRPTKEQQYSFTFDTMACVSFSANNIVEYQVNWMLKNDKISDELKAWLNGNGYLEDGICNLSDRFTAILSGTTKQGNTFQNVWDSIRNNGVIPERMFPFGGRKWEEYHDATLITEEMKALAREWRDRFESEYEWITFDMNQEFTKDQIDACHAALKFGPLHVAVPVPGTHAVTLEGIQEPTLTIFDQYPPFVNINQVNYPIHYAMTGYVSLKGTTAPRLVLKQGMRGDDVKKLQEDLIALGFLKGAADGVFGPITKIGVIGFQKVNKLSPDGIVGPLTFKAIQDKLKKNSTIDKWNLDESIKGKAADFLKKAIEAGYLIRITSGYRSLEEQQRLYDQGRINNLPIVTNLKPGKSKHNFGKAFDICFAGNDPYPSDDKKWKALADIAKSCGLKPGYYFSNKDRPHLEV